MVFQRIVGGSLVRSLRERISAVIVFSSPVQQLKELGGEGSQSAMTSSVQLGGG